jgi:hypothetical protein
VNLHGIVRGAIQTVNPDVMVPYYKSSGYTVGGSFKQAPTYAPVVNVPCQIQALTGKDLRHTELQNIQGVLRAVYMYGNTQGLVRIEAKGGDLLRFAQVPGGTIYTWLVVAVLETWPDWSKVAVSLQLDKAPPT